MIKCIIWDLDNTIWEGIISEDKEVKVRTEIIDIIDKLICKGIVSTICSKNDFFVAKKKLVELNIWDCFVYPQINWKNKTENINAFISKFHFRTENIAFIDDSLFERDLVKNTFKDITVIDGSSINEIRKLVGSINCNYNTLEAQNRVAMYKIEEKRVNDCEQFRGSHLEFLKQCNITVAIRKVVRSDIDRMLDLIERTNQLNTMGIYYSKKQILELMTQKNFDVLIANVCDSYGDYGDSGLVIAKKENKQYIIQLLVVSCRLLGKGISQTLLSCAYERALNDKCEELVCEFLRTKYNRQLRMLFSMNGMQLTDVQNEKCSYVMKCRENKIDYPEWVHINMS